MIKISIIIPVYKVPLEYLRACFDSLVVQTMQECEFIIVSDGAPEAECSVCEEFTKKDSRFKFYKCNHAGVSTARNYGIEHTLGEYITFVDSDDIIIENFCQTVYLKAIEWKSDILLFNQASKNKKALIQYNNLYNKNIDRISEDQFKKLIEHIFFPRITDSPILIRTCCQAYRTSFIKDNKLFFDSSLNYSEDQFFNLVAFLKTRNISYFADYSIYIQFIRHNSLSFSYKADYEKEVYYYLEKIRQVAEANSKLIDLKLFYDRSIQCILYTLDKCIFRPDRKITFKARKSLFRNFVNNKYCKEALLKYDKSNFSLPERIACFLCNKKAFWILFLVSKKWHIQHILGK